ncbi:MAG: CYTH domain-containing protein, partial [Gemmatimonadales bacterium]|nr:CYTH domain-containing protein [Gemmatimonadales bacterium]
MSEPPHAEVKWDVASPERLRELIAAPLPLGLRRGTPHQRLHRDIYYDTPDGALGRRDAVCRFRLGVDDRRALAVTLGSPAESFASPVAELDLAAALRGDSKAARRLRGLVDPTTLEPLAELEVQRTECEAAGRWPWSGRFELVYDAVTVRREGLSRGFQELKIRRLGGGRPTLDQLGAAFNGTPGLRPIRETKLARAERIQATLEGEAIARSLGSGRAVSILALDGGCIAFRRDGDELTLPVADGQGETASRHLLRDTFGSAVGDLALLGTAAGRGSGRLQEVWVVRRVRLDGEGSATIEWLAPADVIARAGSFGLQDPDTLAALAVAMRSELFRNGEPAPPVRRSRPSMPPPVPAEESALLLDPDLSTLEFQARVLAMAESAATPLLERLNFLAIVSANLDEFFMVNVGALKRSGSPEHEAGLE